MVKMAPEDGATRNNGGGGSQGGGGVALKKGPWTAGEDAILIEYVKKHGEGNWNAVQRNSGLNRCGKSCRLRWANHLRPNLKKGAFTPDEERQIIELHSKLGNKWARMALHLHGRTDNEIKNYWNTRLKRRQRAGLPIYPMDMHHQQRHHHEASLNHQLHHPNSSSSSSSYNQKPNTYNAIPALSLFDSFNYPSFNSSSYLSQSQPPFKLFRDNNGCVALSLSSPSPGIPFSTPPSNSLPLFNQLPPSLDFSMNNSIPTIDSSFTGVSLSQRNIETELPSIQSSFQVITPTSSSNNGNDYMVAPSSEVDNYEITPNLCSNGNSGLLGDLLGESQALSRSQIQRTDGKSTSNEENVEKGKVVDNYELMEDPDAMNLESVLGFGDSDTTTHVEDSSSGHSSIEMGPKSNHGVAKEINIEDDDFSDWLDIPITLPFTNWYDVRKNTSNGKTSEVITDGNEEVTQENTAIAHENSQDQVSCSPVATIGLADADHKWTLSSGCWNNMPSFC